MTVGGGTRLRLRVEWSVVTVPSRSRVRTPLAAVFSRIMRSKFAQRHLAPHVAGLQMWLYRRTGGRVQISAFLVPSLVLVTTGAKTGTRRETPLMCWPREDGSFLVAGSNWGQYAHPAWTTNLIANPHVEIVYRRRQWRAAATLLVDGEREAAWPVLEAQWPRYRDYETVAGREMRIFLLVPVELVPVER